VRSVSFGRVPLRIAPLAAVNRNSALECRDGRYLLSHEGWSPTPGATPPPLKRAISCCVRSRSREPRLPSFRQRRNVRRPWPLASVQLRRTAELGPFGSRTLNSDLDGRVGKARDRKGNPCQTRHWTHTVRRYRTHCRSLSRVVRSSCYAYQAAYKIVKEIAERLN
jgi:hypothetical protein